MTKVHFERIAAMLLRNKPVKPPVNTETDRAKMREAVYTGEMYTWKNIVVATAKMCEEENKRFDRERFYAACGYS